MNGKLIDLLLGELPADEARELRTRLGADPALARELASLESLLGLIQSDPGPEPPRAIRDRVLRAAARATTPSLGARLAALPGLARYRFRRSLAFRVALVSLGAHLVLMAVLFQVTVLRPREPVETVLHVVEDPHDPLLIVPDAGLVSNLRQRRLPHGVRLRLLGVEGQERAIEAGLSGILAAQRQDGSFGSSADTGYAALALLAEGDCSALPTARGRTIRAAIGHLLRMADRGSAHGSVLAALVEDYVLSYEFLGPAERDAYVRAILDLIARVGVDEAGREGLALARAANFPIPAGREDEDAPSLLLENRREEYLAAPPTRLSTSLVLARGQSDLDPAVVRAWARPLFEAAVEELARDPFSPVAVLTLQAPYRW